MVVKTQNKIKFNSAVGAENMKTILVIKINNNLKYACIVIINNMIKYVTNSITFVSKYIVKTIKYV